MAFGLPLPQRRRPSSDDFEGEGGSFLVLPENWPAVRAFLACASQWRRDQGLLTGLDYAGCRAAVAGLGLKWREVFDPLRVMEAEVMEAQSEAQRS